MGRITIASTNDTRWKRLAEADVRSSIKRSRLLGERLVNSAIQAKRTGGILRLPSSKRKRDNSSVKTVMFTTITPPPPSLHPHHIVSHKRLSLSLNQKEKNVAHT